jgi:hypothetical protein
MKFDLKPKKPRTLIDIGEDQVKALEAEWRL